MADGSQAPPTIKTTCPYCGVGCGVQGRVGQARDLIVSGDIAHPANAGRLCSKGTALGATMGLEGRLLVPMIGEREASWNEATALVDADLFRLSPATALTLSPSMSPGNC